MRKTARGLTLIELLVAIAIFALLGMMSYRAIYSATESQRRLSDEYTDWQRISRTLNRIENELIQIGVRPLGQPSKVASLLVTSAPGGGSRLIYWRLDTDQGAKFSGIEYANEKLSLLRWKTADTLATPNRDVLLDGVQSVRWQYAARGDATWRDSWPVSTTRNGEAPDGIRLEIELTGKGKISRVYALR